jgi:hypothetical protein
MGRREGAEVRSMISRPARDRNQARRTA